MVNYECADCGFHTTLKSNYKRHMVSKKHYLMTETEPTEEDTLSLYSKL